jgi:S1-C subfamily serine protease
LKVTPAGEDGPAIALPEIAGHMAPFHFRVPGIDIPDFDVEIRAGSRLGVMVSDLTEQLAGHFGVKDGVLVNEVVADSPAAAAGIKAGDVITSVGGKAVESAGDIRRSVGQVEGDEVTVGIVRDRKEQAVTVKIEREERRQRTRRIMM